MIKILNVPLERSLFAQVFSVSWLKAAKAEGGSEGTTLAVKMPLSLTKKYLPTAFINLFIYLTLFNQLLYDKKLTQVSLTPVIYVDKYTLAKSKRNIKVS